MRVFAYFRFFEMNFITMGTLRRLGWVEKGEVLNLNGFDSSTFIFLKLFLEGV